MLFVVVDKEGKEDVLLVKAKDSEEVKKRLKLSPTQEVAASFTTSETQTLDSASFAVISS